jgi:hypothetical protein
MNFMRTRIGMIAWSIFMLQCGYVSAVYSDTRFVVVKVRPAKVTDMTPSESNQPDVSLRWSHI